MSSGGRRLRTSQRAARDPIETGKDWPMHLMPQATTSVCNHLPAFTPSVFSPHQHTRSSVRKKRQFERNDACELNPLGWRGFGDCAVPMIGAKTGKRKCTTGFPALPTVWATRRVRIQKFVGGTPLPQNELSR